MNAMDLSDQDDVDGFVDMEGELRFTLEDLNESRENIYYLRSLLDKGKKVIDDFKKKIDKTTK